MKHNVNAFRTNRCPSTIKVPLSELGEVFRVVQEVPFRDASQTLLGVLSEAPLRYFIRVLQGVSQRAPFRGALQSTSRVLPRETPL